MLTPAMEFDALKIDNAGITDIKIVPWHKIALSLTVFPDPKSLEATLPYYHLQFNKVVGFKLALPLCGVYSIVTAHRAADSSAFLDTCIEKARHSRAKYNTDRLIEYSLEFADGHLEVVAESFTCSVTLES